MPHVVAAQPNIGGAVSESYVISFLVPRHKVWLMAPARVPCSNAGNIGERKIWTQSQFYTGKILLRGNSPGKCIYNVPAQETAKHHEKFGWLPLIDVAAVTKPRLETR